MPSPTLRRFFLGTQRPPLLWAYRAAYWAAVRIVVGRLRKTRGVVAAYLVGGLLDAPVYGLSDVDVAVVVDDPKGDVAPRVFELLAYLNTLLPMLESPERAGILERGALAGWLAKDPMLQYRLGPHRPKRLLLGEDVLAAIPASASREAQCLAELGHWWEVTRRVLVLGPGLPGSAYALHKMVAAAYRAVLFARTGEYVAARADVLARVPPGLLAPDAARLVAAPLSAEVVGPALAFGALHAIVRDWASDAASVPSGAPLDVGAPPPAATALAEIARLFPAAVVRCLPDVDPDHEGRFDRALVAVQVEPLDDDALLSLASLARGQPARVALERDGVLYPLWDTDERIALGRTHPELFSSGATPARRAVLAARLAERRSAAAQLLRSPEAFRLSGREALELVCAGVEAAANADGAPLRLLGSAADLPRFVSPEDGAVAAELGHAFLAGVTELPVRLHHAALSLLARRLGVPEPSAGAPREHLDLSVVICTRNRAERLRGALAGLALQRRPPDEIVVVDNGSSDHTRAVVEAFVARPVRYAYLAEPSIPAARNHGARLATGDVICYTDDDAVPDPAWLARLEAIFLRDPHVGVAGGDMLPAPQSGLLADFFREYMGPER